MTATAALPQRRRVHHGDTPRPLRQLQVDAAVFRRRRRIASIGLVVALSALGLGAQAILTDSGSAPASAAGVGTVPVRRQITSQPGDSLWSIAEAHRGDIGVQAYVDALVVLNGGETRIVVGQAVTLP